MDQVDGPGIQWQRVPSPELTDIPEFHLGDAIYKLMQSKGLDRKKIALATGLRRNTVGALINQATESEPKTISAVLQVLGVDRAYVDLMVAQMNGKLSKVVAIRPKDAKEREIDRDPVKRECMEFGMRTAALPSDARMAIFNVIRALEGAYGHKRLD